MTAWLRVRSPVGVLAIEATEAGVVAVRFGDSGPSRPGVSAAARAHAEAAEAALSDYFAGRPPGIRRGLRRPLSDEQGSPGPGWPVKLDLRGTDFQRAVWRALLDIPWGEVRSYGEVAALLGRPGAARAVGSANHENPVAILVPCHRVVQAQGRLGGYGGGLESKRWLLAHEAAHAPVLRLG
jgi:methylated-DNA-[protein]-cysteine S-methyltransferase